MNRISFHASTVLILGSAASVAPSPFASFARFHASRELRRMSFLRPNEIVGSGFTPTTRLLMRLYTWALEHFSSCATSYTVRTLSIDGSEDRLVVTSRGELGDLV